MPRYAAEPDRYPGSLPSPIFPANFADRDGKVIDRAVAYVDTDLGIVIAHVLDRAGKPVYSLEVGCVQEVVELYRAPLTPIPVRPFASCNKAQLITDLTSPDIVLRLRDV